MIQTLNATEAIKLGDEILKSKKNSFLFLTGDNGSGKSTLLLNIAKKIAGNKNIDQLNHSIADDNLQKVIAYSMAPFSKFDSREAYDVTTENSFERIGGGSSGTSRYALLFQAIVQFCISDKDKQPLFQEIAKVTRFSATFRVRLRIDRQRLERFPRKAVDDNQLAKKILGSSGSLEVYMRPGTVRMTASPEADMPPSSFEKQILLDQTDDSYHIADALMLLRRHGALRVIRVEYARTDDTWCSSDYLSSGQLSFFVGLMVLASALRDDCIVLIDEPEVSLHPAWQEKYPQLLYKMAKYYQRCKFYVATHSPVIVSSAKNEGAEIINLGSKLIGLSDLADTGPENIEEVYAIYFNTLTVNSHFLKETAIKATKALAEKDSAEFFTYSQILRKLRPRVQDVQTKKLISEILKRTIS